MCVCLEAAGISGVYQVCVKCLFSEDSSCPNHDSYVREVNPHFCFVICCMCGWSVSVCACAWIWTLTRLPARGSVVTQKEAHLCPVLSPSLEHIKATCGFAAQQVSILNDPKRNFFHM